MQSPPNITFRHLERTPEVEEHIHRRIEELQKYHPRIVSCDVVIDAPQKTHITGREFKVHLTVHVPGPDIHVSRSLGRSEAAEDLNLAIHKVFDAARRELKEQERKMGAVEVKHHAPVLHGTIDRLFEGEGYGFIRADDGREVYFGRDSMTAGDWTALKVDTKVRFREESGDKGPYAASVAVVG